MSDVTRHAKWSPLTKAQRARIQRASKAGKTVREIAAEIGISPTTVQKWRHRQTTKPKAPRRRRSTKLVGKAHRQLVGARRRKYTLAHIARRLRKMKIVTSVSSVRRALLREHDEVKPIYPWRRIDPKRFRRPRRID